MIRPSAPGIPRLAAPLCCLARGIDLAMGAPDGWVMKACLLAMRLSEILGWNEEQRSETFYVVLLRHAGCSATAGTEARVFGDEMAAHRVFPWGHDESHGWQAAFQVVRHLAVDRLPLRRAELLLRFFAAPSALDAAGLPDQHCEVAQAFGEVLELGPGIRNALGHAYERWDGRGHPHRVAGEEIPPSARLAAFALDVSWFSSLGGRVLADEMVRRRAGRLHDPVLSQAYLPHAATLSAELETTALWEAVMDTEPRPWKTRDQDLPLLTLFADFADLKSPWFLGFSRRVHDLVTAAGRLQLEEDEWELARRAALVQGLGRVGVSASVWGKPGALSQAELDDVRTYPALTQRVFSWSKALAPLGRTAAEVQERLDGSGYPKGLASQAPGSRLLSAAQMYVALISPRPHRPARDAQEAARELAHQVKQGRLDRDAVQAILGAVGQTRVVPLPDLPFGLTARELDVLRQIARGLSNKEMARRLGIAEKTAGRHIERLYEKIRVRTRAGATLFAVRNSLL